MRNGNIDRRQRSPQVSVCLAITTYTTVAFPPVQHIPEAIYVGSVTQLLRLLFKVQIQAACSPTWRAFSQVITVTCNG